MTDIAALGIKIDSTDAKNAQAELKRLTAEGAKTEKAFDQIGKKIGLSIASAAAGVSVMVKAALNLADSTGKAAQAAGVSTTAFSELQYAARLGGVEAAAFSSSFTKLAKNIGDAASGTGEARGAFEQLGIKVKDATGQVISADKAFALVADRFSRMQDGAQKTAIATKLFGEAGAKLIPTLNGGARGLKDMGDEARAFGLVIDDEAAKAAEKFNDDLDRMKALAQGAAQSLSQYLVPVMSSLLQSVKDINASSLIGWLLTSGEQARNAGANVAKLTEDLAKLEQEAADYEKASPLAKAWSFEDKLLRDLRRKALEERRKYLLEIQKNEALSAGEGIQDSRAGVRPEPFIPKPPGPTAKEIAEANRIRKAQLAADVADIQRELDRLLASYKNTERLLEASRDAGLVSEADYYTEKRQMVKLASDSEIALLQNEADRLRKEKLSGAERIANLSKIADIEASIARKRDDATVSIQVLTSQQETSLARQAAAFKQAQASALEYYLSVQQAQERELASLGAGDQARRRNAGLQQIEDRYQQQLQDLNRDRLGAQTEEQRRQIAQQEALVREFRTKALASYNDYYDRLLEKQKDFGVGAREALQNFVDDSANAAAQAQSLIGGAFNRAADAVANFVTTGKLDFKGFINSIIADLVRIQAQKALSGIAQAILNGFSGGFGSGNDFGNQDLGQNFARGGVVTRATPFRFANGAGFSPGLMGEAGPEAIMPLRRGSDGRLGVQASGGGSTVNHFSISIQGSSQPMNAWELERVLESGTIAALQKHRQRTGTDG